MIELHWKGLYWQERM